jgi:6-phosphogluconate dehydrogenase
MGHHWERFALNGRELGLIGLGVMGQNLALNFQTHAHSVVAYNRTEQKTRDFVGKHPEIEAAYTIPSFIEKLDRPRKIFLMVTAGVAVDANITALRDYLSPEDVVMDGGNSFFKDTERRCDELAKRGVHFLGVGVSGGEEGALNGPCIMVGGASEGYEQVRHMLTDVAAQADGACCQLLGPRGAGHYVKMVHNGIEYGIMQIIAEAYDILNRAMRVNNKEIHDIFAKWNEGELNSFLMEITEKVLGERDPESRKPLVQVILDRAKQKGTGKWTSQNALDLGIPTPTIDAAVSARNMSALKEERIEASRVLKRTEKATRIASSFADRIERAVQGSIIVAYAQGFHLMRAASHEYGYHVPFGEVARIWKGGCIIRAKVLNPITQAFAQHSDLQNLLLYRDFAHTLKKIEKDWRDVVKRAEDAAVPTPAIGASLDYYDSYRSERLPANLIQALRDNFGAHGYERIDKSGEFHTDWA